MQPARPWSTFTGESLSGTLGFSGPPSFSVLSMLVYVQRASAEKQPGGAVRELPKGPQIDQRGPNVQPQGGQNHGETELEEPKRLVGMTILGTPCLFLWSLSSLRVPCPLIQALLWDTE